MGSLSDFAENKLLDHLLNAAYTPIADLYIALCSADPTDAATGAVCNELADANDYAREIIIFGAAGLRKISQSNTISFNEALGAWGTVTHWVVVDSAVYGEGNVLAHGVVSPAISPIAGNVAVLASGQVEIDIAASIGAGFSTYAINKLLDLMFRNQAFTSTAGSVFVALLSVIADDDDAATTDLTEMTGTDYARTVVNASAGASPKWTAASGGEVTNADIVSLATPGDDDWDEIVAVALVDTLTGLANVLAFDNTNIVDQTPAGGDTIQFDVGALKLSLS